MNPTTNLKTIISKLSKLLTVSTAFLVPIFFLPVTTEFFAFNKLALITIVTLLLIFIWGLKIIIGDKIEITKSTIDRPLLLIIGTCILATIFSISKGDSLYGSPGRWLGLFSFLILVIYFYISSPLLKGIKTIKAALYAFLSGAAVSTVVAIFGYYQIYVGTADFIRGTYFTLTGSINDAILLAALSVVVTIASIVYERNPAIKMVLVSLSALNFFYVAITGSLLGWAIVVLGIIGCTLLFDKNKLLSSKVEFVSLGFTMAVILAAVLVPTTKSVIKNPGYRSDLVLPLRESWLVATSTIQDHPILATGPGTFYINFSRYRPLSLNTTNTWNVQFNLPYNGLFEVLATLGIIGAGVVTHFAWKIFSFAQATKKLQDESGISRIVGVLVLTILASFLFTFPTIINVYLVFFALSLLVAVYASISNQFRYVKTISVGIEGMMTLRADDSSIVSGEYFKYVLSIPVFLFAGYIGYMGYKQYAAEYYMRQAILATIRNDGTQAYNLQGLAIQNNPRRDYYYTSYARTNLALANTLASKTDLTDAERQTIQTLLSQAIRNTRIASENLNSLNARNWETRAVVYRSLLNVAQNATDWAINSYNTAIQLDPSNPRLRVDLGGIYYATGDFLSAANQFRQAIILKQDYANAHYNFAMALINLQDIENAKKELEIAKLLVLEGSVDYETVVNQLASLESLPEVAGAIAEEKPTVEEITGIEEEETEQEPLVNVGEEQPGENLDVEALPEQEDKKE